MLSASGGNRGRSHPRYAGPLLPAHAAASIPSSWFERKCCRRPAAIAAGRIPAMRGPCSLLMPPPGRSAPRSFPRPASGGGSGSTSSETSAATTPACSEATSASAGPGRSSAVPFRYVGCAMAMPALHRFWLAGARRRGWLWKRGCRDGAVRYAVKINLRFCVSRKRYSRPSCSMINSFAVASSVWLLTRIGVFSFRGRSAGLSGRCCSCFFCSLIYE